MTKKITYQREQPKQSISNITYQREQPKQSISNPTQPKANITQSNIALSFLHLNRPFYHQFLTNSSSNPKLIITNSICPQTKSTKKVPKKVNSIITYQLYSISIQSYYYLFCLSCHRVIFYSIHLS